MVVAIFINVISVWDRPAKRQQCIRKQTTQEAVGRRVRILGGRGGGGLMLSENIQPKSFQMPAAVVCSVWLGELDPDVGRPVERGPTHPRPS